MKYPSIIKNSIEQFNGDFSGDQLTAFIMMEFGKLPIYNEIHMLIKKILIEKFNIIGLRADFKDYHDDLFANVHVFL